VTTDLVPVLPAILDVVIRAEVGLVVIALRDGRFEKWYANEPAVGGLGYTPSEWLALPVFEVFPPEDRAAVRQLFERLASGPPLPPVVEVTFRHRDGHLIPVELAAGRADVPGGRALVLIIRERGLPRQAQLSLLEADRIALVGALAAGFAHETNNPLTSVLLNLRSLRKQLLTNLAEPAQATALRCLDDITVGAERIASNVRALQTLATRSATPTVDLAAVVSAALRLAAPTLEPRAHVVRQIVPVGQVRGEESRIGQAVLAMMLFSSSGFDGEVPNTGNRIVVAVEQRAGRAVVEVSDNGRDLAPEEAERAFDPFFRSSSRGAGVGVGLGVARSVAATLGGDVALASRPGGGAVITLRLPPAPGPA
jgi:PAS domain S-box-containing protein